MPREIFYVPVVGTGSRSDPFRAQYSDTSGIISDGMIRYSRSSVCIAMFEADQAILDTIAGLPNADRWVAEADLQLEIPGARVPSLRNTLEAEGIPGTWISASDSWRETLRGIIGMLLFAQRHEGFTGSGFFADLEASGGGLNTQWQSLDPDFQLTMTSTALSFSTKEKPVVFNPDPNTQVRAILRDFADIFVGKQFFIGGLEI